MERLRWEMTKDQEQTEKIKEKQIAEILSLDKSLMFQPPPKKRLSLLTRLKIVLGNGKEG
jgi:hypothetical protein